MKYTVAEFRKNMREAFEAAERGELVEIERYDQSFYLVEDTNINEDDILDVPLATKENVLNGAQTPKKEEDPIDEWFESHGKGNKDTPVESNNNGKLCCTLKIPCKHWEFDGTQQAWVNVLTGEVKEVN